MVVYDEAKETKDFSDFFEPFCCCRQLIHQSILGGPNYRERQLLHYHQQSWHSLVLLVPLVKEKGSGFPVTLLSVMNMSLI